MYRPSTQTVRVITLEENEELIAYHYQCLAEVESRKQPKLQEHPDEKLMGLRQIIALRKTFVARRDQADLQAQVSVDQAETRHSDNIQLAERRMHSETAEAERVYNRSVMKNRHTRDQAVEMAHVVLAETLKAIIDEAAAAGITDLMR